MKFKHFSVALSFCFFCAVALVALLAGCKKDDPPGNDGSLTAAFTHSLQPNCPVPCQVCFTNTSQNATSYTWDFGNGQTSSEAAPCVTFTTRGTYTVTLTARRGTESVVATQTLTVQDNVQRYKRTFAANGNATITHLLDHNGSTYMMIKDNGIYKMTRFNSTGESYANFPGTLSTISDMVADPSGSILCVGSGGFPSIVGLTKLTSAMTLNFERYYNIGTPSDGSSVVLKNTNNTPGYIIGGRLDNGTYHQARLINTYDDGALDFSDPVSDAHSINKIFRNAGSGSYSYVTIGTWLDPLQQRTDIHISTANENGVDYLPIHLYLGLDNFFNDGVSDAVQYGNGASYAGVGSLGDKPTFFAFSYQNQTFSQPLVVQGFTTGSLTLNGVCALANGQGFGICGTEFSGGAYSIFVAKLSSAGNIVWQKRLSTGGLALGMDIISTPDGGMLVGGAEICASLTCYYPVLYKLDGNGDFQ